MTFEELQEKYKNKCNRVSDLIKKISDLKVKNDNLHQSYMTLRIENYNLKDEIELLKRDKPLKAFKVHYTADAKSAPSLKWDEILTGYCAADIINRLQERRYSNYHLDSISVIPE